jgi:hypothetical protein
MSDDQTAAPAEKPEPTEAPPLARRLASAAGTLAVAVIVPVVLAFLAGGGVAAGGAALGAVLSFVLALLSGWRRAAIFVIPTLAAAGLSAMVSGTPWWVVGLVVLGFLTGVLAARGLLVPFAFMGLAWSVSKPTEPAGDLLVLLLFAAISAVYAIVLARRAGVPPDAGAVALPTSGAVTAGIGLAIAAGLAGVISQRWEVENAYWLPMTIFVLALPAPGVRLSRRALTRVIGTAAGVGAAIATSALVDVPAVDYALAFGALVLTLAVPNPRWFNAATTAFAIVLALTPTSGADVGSARLGATVLGAGIVVAIAIVLALVTRLMPQSAGQREVVAQFDEARSADDA